MQKSHQMMKPASPLKQGLATTNTECIKGERTALLSKHFPPRRESHLACLACSQPSPKLSFCRAHTDPALCAHPGPSPTWTWVLRFFCKRTCAQ